MLHLDAVDRWVALATGRTLDQHAADPIPAAAHLPSAASTLRHARTDLLLAVDRLRTLLINADDLTATVSTVAGPLETITELARDYRYARNWVDALIDDRNRTEYAEAHPGRSVRRRYVNPGDTVLVSCPTPTRAASSSSPGGPAAYRSASPTLSSPRPAAPSRCGCPTPTPGSTTTRPRAASTSSTPPPTGPPPPATDLPARHHTAPRPPGRKTRAAQSTAAHGSTRLPR